MFKMFVSCHPSMMDHPQSVVCGQYECDHIAWLLVEWCINIMNVSGKKAMKNSIEIGI